MGALLQGAAECEDAATRALVAEAAAFGVAGGRGELRERLAGALSGVPAPAAPAELAALVRGALGTPSALGCPEPRQKSEFSGDAAARPAAGGCRGPGWEEGLCDSLRRSDPVVRRAAADAAALHLGALLAEGDPAGGAPTPLWDFPEQRECLQLMFVPPEDEADLWRAAAAASLVRLALRSAPVLGAPGGETGALRGLRAAEVLNLAAGALVEPGFVDQAAESRDRAVAAGTLTAFACAALRGGAEAPPAQAAVQQVAHRLLLWAGPRAPPNLAVAAALGILELAGEWPGSGGDEMAAAGTEALLALLREPALRGVSGKALLGAARGTAFLAARGAGGTPGTLPTRLGARMLSEALAHVMAGTALEPETRAGALALLARGAFLWELRQPTPASAPAPSGSGSPASPLGTAGVLQGLLLHRAVSEGSRPAVLCGAMGREARLVFLRTALAECPPCGAPSGGSPACEATARRWQGAAMGVLRWAAPACFDSTASAGELCLLVTLAAAALAFPDPQSAGGDTPEALLLEWLAPDQVLSLAARHQVIRLAAACGPAAALAAAGPTLARAGVEAGRISDGGGGGGDKGGAGGGLPSPAGVLEPLVLREVSGESGVLNADALWGEWIESAEALALAAVGPRGDPAAAKALNSALEEVARDAGVGRAAAEGVSAAFSLSIALAHEGGSPPPSEEGGFVAGRDAVTERLLQLSGLGASYAAAEDRCTRAVQGAGVYVATASRESAIGRGAAAPGPPGEVVSAAAVCLPGLEALGADAGGSAGMAQLTAFWPEGLLVAEVAAPEGRQLPPQVSGRGAFAGAKFPGPFPLANNPRRASFSVPLGGGLEPRGFDLQACGPSASQEPTGAVFVPLRLLCRPPAAVPPLAPGEFGRVWHRLPYRVQLTPEGPAAALKPTALSVLAARLAAPASSPWVAEHAVREVAPGLWHGLYRTLSRAGGWVLLSLAAESAGGGALGLRASLRAAEPLGAWSATDWDALVLGGLLAAAPPSAPVGTEGRRAPGWAALRAACAAEHRDARAGAPPPGAPAGALI